MEDRGLPQHFRQKVLTGVDEFGVPTFEFLHCVCRFLLPVREQGFGNKEQMKSTVAYPNLSNRPATARTPLSNKLKLHMLYFTKFVLMETLS